MNVAKLDCPAWYSLSEVHRDFSLEYGGIKFYRPEFCPFGGSISSELTEEGIELYGSLTNDFFVIGEKPAFGKGVNLSYKLICDQMVLDERIDIDITETITKLHTAEELLELFELVNMVQPGYFKRKTPGLGNYYGIYKNGKLVAAAGERMKMDGYTEVSAVVTHPKYTGRGYAKELLAHATNQIFVENKIPYLHVTSDNRVAIHLYQKLGFEKRREINFWNFKTQKN